MADKRVSQTLEPGLIGKDDVPVFRTPLKKRGDVRGLEGGPAMGTWARAGFCSLRSMLL
jgi:hypothetical protein